MGRQITLVGANGALFDVAGTPAAEGVRIRKGGLPNLSSRLSPRVVEPIGYGGGRVLRGRARVNPINGTLGLQIRGQDAPSLYREVMGCFDHEAPAIIRQVDGARVIELEVRLADGQSIEPAETLPEGHHLVNMDVPIVVHRGCWVESHIVKATSVTVDNTGPVEVIPSIEWTTGGDVVMPSGAKFILPTVPAKRILSLDLAESYPVTDAEGVLDRSLYKQIRGRVVLAETVPPGATRTYKLPAGASLVYKVGVKNQWV